MMPQLVKTEHRSTKVLLPSSSRSTHGRNSLPGSGTCRGFFIHCPLSCKAGHTTWQVKQPRYQYSLSLRR